MNKICNHEHATLNAFGYRICDECGLNMGNPGVASSASLSPLPPGEEYPKELFTEGMYVSRVVKPMEDKTKPEWEKELDNLASDVFLDEEPTEKYKIFIRSLKKQWTDEAYWKGKNEEGIKIYDAEVSFEKAIDKARQEVKDEIMEAVRIKPGGAIKTDANNIDDFSKGYMERQKEIEEVLSHLKS